MLFLAVLLPRSSNDRPKNLYRLVTELLLNGVLIAANLEEAVPCQLFSNFYGKIF
ncbi:MAG: hypothetical protein JSC188_001108 [Candidatus Tokpelaia sp. JSC188]|nr:MAG: hypothetical protein JSC188_001108 [Candidatus Tokpelaia sp. JSC188]